MVFIGADVGCLCGAGAGSRRPHRFSSAEAEFHAAYAERLGPEGEGARTILAMVQWTRLDCAVSSASQMRFGLAQALHHARHRAVFGRLLADQPAMRAVLADLALECEANTALVFRVTRACGRGPTTRPKPPTRG